ncbi:MAG: hypothetical protein UHM23_01635 [Clostridia bacterium]|nr:hypothetical protein [Clostridia bacterium]
MGNNNKKKEDRSMYLYTALIFVVALLLILIAFFSQSNISRLGNRANEFNTASPASELTNTPVPTDEFAKIANMASELDTKNKALTAQVEIYDKLLLANAYVYSEEYEQAETVINTVDAGSLSENQNILYEQIKEKINERKEQ